MGWLPRTGYLHRNPSNFSGATEFNWILSCVKVIKLLAMKNGPKWKEIWSEWRETISCCTFSLKCTQAITSWRRKAEARFRWMWSLGLCRESQSGNEKIKKRCGSWSAFVVTSRMPHRISLGICPLFFMGILREVSMTKEKFHIFYKAAKIHLFVALKTFRENEKKQKLIHSLQHLFFVMLIWTCFSPQAFDPNWIKFPKWVMCC